MIPWNYSEDKSTLSEGWYPHGPDPEKRDWLPDPHPFSRGAVADAAPAGYPPGTPLNTYAGPGVSSDPIGGSGLVPEDQAHYYSGYWAGVQAAQYGFGGNSYGNLKPWPFAIPHDDPFIYRFRRREPLIREAAVMNRQLLYPFRDHLPNWGRVPGLPWDRPPTIYEDLPPEADVRDDGTGRLSTSFDYSSPINSFNPLPFLRKARSPFDDLINKNESIGWGWSNVPIANVVPMTNDAVAGFEGTAPQLSGDPRRMEGALSDTGSPHASITPFLPVPGLPNSFEEFP